MELSTPNSVSLKIQSKKGAVLINPDLSDEAKIVIIDDNSDDISDKFSDTLVIFGPGDYEVGGIMVKGSRSEGNTIYEIDTGEGKIIHALSNSIKKISAEDDFNAVVVKAVGPVEEASLSPLSSKLVVVYGDPANIEEGVKENSVSKINFKKTDDLTSNVVFLVKK